MTIRTLWNCSHFSHVILNYTFELVQINTISSNFFGGKCEIRTRTGPVGLTSPRKAVLLPVQSIFHFGIRAHFWCPHRDSNSEHSHFERDASTEIGLCGRNGGAGEI